MRIFFKLLLSFCVATLLAAGLTVWAGYYLHPEVDLAMHQELEESQAARVQAAKLLITKGWEALRADLPGIPMAHRLRVLNAQGQEIFGREWSFYPGGHQQRPDYPSPPETREEHHLPPPFEPLVVQLADGESGRIFITPSGPRFFQVLWRHPGWGLTILGSVLLAVLLPALHFSLPLQRLRQMTRCVANWDLRARSGPVRRWVRDEVSMLAEDFDFMAQRLEELFHAQKRLLRDVSHELRSPLARMRIAIGLLETRQEEPATMLAVLEQEMERMESLISQILTLSNPEQTNVALHREDLVDLPVLLRTVATTARLEAVPRDQQIICEFQDEVLLLANGEALHSSLENVVRNGLRHSPEGGTVTVRLERCDGVAVVTVEDEGAGIPPEYLQRIFDPFFRVSEARDRESGGFGLGLAIAAQVIHDHHGEIQAVNRSSGGLAMIIRLPVDEGLQQQFESGESFDASVPLKHASS